MVYRDFALFVFSRDPEPDQKLQDLVNKTMWKKCCFSGDGEFVCAGSARQHALYIWEKATGTLMKILHGTKGEILHDVVVRVAACLCLRRTNSSIPCLLSSSQWHPVRPIVASISQGVVTVWAQQQVENWSAFAPDFKELDENVDYEERESEFDLEDEDRSVKDEDEDGGGGKNSKKGAGADGEVNVCSVDPIPAFCSSDEEDEGGEEAEKDKDKGGESSSSLLYLPIAPEIEEPEDHWVPGVDDEGGSGGGAGEGPSDRGSKRDAAKENASPSKRKRTKTTEIALPNAPKDGKESNCLVNNTKR